MRPTWLLGWRFCALRLSRHRSTSAWSILLGLIHGHGEVEQVRNKARITLPHRDGCEHHLLRDRAYGSADLLFFGECERRAFAQSLHLRGSEISDPFLSCKREG